MTTPAAKSPLFTDLYEITMAAGYDANGLESDATFSVFVRHSPTRSFYIAAGLNDVMDAIAAFRFSGEDLHFLDETGRFSKGFLEKLKTLRFTGSVAAMPEGTGLKQFALRFPDRFFDVGIAEQHGVTFAAGLAAEGFRPVVAIYSTFLQRAFDQIIHDVCLENLPVLLGNYQPMPYSISAYV